ncbi:cyclin-A1-4-like isoform X2 [Telopea speciosissima]|uniref:cyclin-A1-4-like isoform X2 n=1 Tax=Telopea speciosissima TaxID=54955 RepID=UPI001CC52A34|nr:cyclin-A1-4-like isoform X2 [Telopea speciosissima]
MSTRNRRSSLSMPSSSAAKRPASSENATKISAVQPLQAKKRPALTNLTNQNNVSRTTVRTSGTAATQASSATKTTKIKKVSSSHVKTTAFPRSSVPESSAMKSRTVVSCKDVSAQKSDGPVSSIAAPVAPSSMYISPSRSDGCSVSLDETMSTCDSLKSPDIEYLDTADVSAVASIERRTCNNLYISDHVELATDKIVNVDDNYKDPQLCATIACDIYKHLRASETKKRPSTNFMEEVQKDVNASMRAILIDWLVEVAEEYRLVPDTLYLTVNYIDRYLSGNVMNRQRLQLLGVACMMIAAKYEEICAPQVEEFCYITDNTYFKEEVLQMETAVLNYLKFEMTAPTAKCFLRRFVRAAQGSNEVPLLLLECQANYLAELSLLEYGMLCYAPSLIAASSIFLANFILQPSKRPWNATLGHYTLYKPSELRDCVKALHHLACSSHSTTLLAIREKYSQHKYKSVAKKYCPPSIPVEHFYDLGN